MDGKIRFFFFILCAGSGQKRVSVMTIDERAEAERARQAYAQQGRFADIAFEFCEPPGQDRDAITVELACTVQVFREPGNFVHQMAVEQRLEPGRDLLAEMALDLGFEDCIGKPVDIALVDRPKRVVDAGIGAAPVVARAQLTIQTVFAHECQVAVQGDPQTLVAGYLERGAVVKDAAHGCKLATQDGALDAVGHKVLFVDGFLVDAPGAQVGGKVVGGVDTVGVAVDELLLEPESVLDRGAVQPGRMVRLALDIDVAGFLAVPAKPDGLRAIGAFQSLGVQVERGVVVVDRGDGGVVGLVAFLLVVDVDWQMEQDDGFDFGDIVGVHPVFCCRPFKRGLLLFCFFLLLLWLLLLIVIFSKRAPSMATARSANVIAVRDPHDEFIELLLNLVEGPLNEHVRGVSGSQIELRVLVVFLDHFLKAFQVDLLEASEIVHVKEDLGEGLREAVEKTLVIPVVELKKLLALRDAWRELLAYIVVRKSKHAL